MRYPSPGRKSNAISGLQSVQTAVDPRIRGSVNDEYELFFQAFGMRKGGSAAGEQRFVVYSELLKTKMFSKLGPYTQ
jgi:hypothetical protein